jgi:flagellar motility protein MotE (MotC chaperone)
MSGVEVPRKQREEHTCLPCTKTVVQTFSYFQKQIKVLRDEKADLQERIRVLEEETAQLKKSASRKNR